MGVQRSQLTQRIPKGYSLLSKTLNPKILQKLQGTAIRKILDRLLGNQYPWGEPQNLFLRNPLGPLRTSKPLLKPLDTVSFRAISCRNLSQ